VFFGENFQRTLERVGKELVVQCRFLDRFFDFVRAMVVGRDGFFGFSEALVKAPYRYIDQGKC
jgi:hypothetical protein